MINYNAGKQKHFSMSRLRENKTDFLKFIETPREKNFPTSHARCINSLLMREFSPRVTKETSHSKADFAQPKHKQNN